MISKLPRITLYFWILKICATTLGETGGDFFSMTMKAGYAVSSLVLFSLFLIALAFQLAAKSYRPLLYWTVILLTSTAGTTISDFMDRTLELGYAKGSLILVLLLLSTLTIWRIVCGSLSVEHIRSRKAETFYWIAILFSNTLGTALGDFLSDNSGLGFAGGALLIGGLLTVIALFYFYTKVSRILLFWAAFILTRPFGATVGDFLTKEKGGLNLGTFWSSSVLAGILLALLMITIKNRSLHPAAEAEGP